MACLASASEGSGDGSSWVHGHRSSGVHRDHPLVRGQLFDVLPKELIDRVIKSLGENHFDPGLVAWERSLGEACPPPCVGFWDAVPVRSALLHLRGAQPLQLAMHKPESKRPYCWKQHEVAAMMRHCNSRNGLSWLGDAIVALACTGLRISELITLRWSDVDVKGGRLQLIDETGHAGKPVKERRGLKSGRSRSFPIHPYLLDVLRRRPKEGPFIFSGPRGGRLKADTVRRVLIREVLEPLAKKFPTDDGEQGFLDGRLHSFRHYFCSTCAIRSVPEQMLMAWLGHADSEMVRHYYHMNDDLARRKMNEIDFLGQELDGPTPTGNINQEHAGQNESTQIKREGD